MQQFSEHKLRTKLIRLLMLVVLGVISGCSHISQHPVPPASTRTVQKIISKLASWELQGGITILRAEQREYCRFTWMHQGEYCKIKLSGPLNFGQIQLVGSKSGAELIANGRTVRASDIAALIQEQLGYSLPIADMSYLIFGVQPTRHSVLKKPVQPTHEYQVKFDKYYYHSVLKIWLPKQIEVAYRGLTVKIKVLKHQFING